MRILIIVWAVMAAAAQTTTTTQPVTDAAGSTTTTQPATGSTSGATPQTGPPRPIFLSGVVMTDNGSPLPSNVNIQSVCGVARRTMAHVTDSGSFGFQWTNMTIAFGDASQMGRNPGTGAASLTGSRNGARGLDPLANCELFADVPGYSSTKASLFNRGGQDNFDVGVIVLHLIAAGDGHSVSLLALQAPKNAKKAFDKGISLTAANKPTEALASFEVAVTDYPQYADAWLDMGKIQWQLGRKEDARASFRKSMDLDNKLVGPWQELGFMACDDSKWEEALKYLDQAVRLDPIDSPIPWYFDALANYNMGHYAEAERSVRAELKLDRGKNPQADYLLGLVLIARQDLEGGAEALRNYIAAAPPSADVATARRELSRLENGIRK